jgi:hypothetical protein
VNNFKSCYSFWKKSYFRKLLKKTKMKITKRDINFFLLGIFIMFLIMLIFDWDSFVKGFNDGYNGREYNPKIENTK